MKRSPFWWLNFLVIAVYLVVALFIDANGRMFGMNASVSKFVMHGLLVGGVGIAALSLFKSPKQWPVPVLCLVIYLAFAF